MPEPKKQSIAFHRILLNMPEPKKQSIAFHQIDAEDRGVLEGLLIDIATRRQLAASGVLTAKLDAELKLLQRLISA